MNFSTELIVGGIKRIGRAAEPEIKPIIAVVVVRIDLSQDKGRGFQCVVGGNRVHSSAIGALQMCREGPARHGDVAENTLAPNG